MSKDNRGGGERRGKVEVSRGLGSGCLESPRVRGVVAGVVTRVHFAWSQRALTRLLIATASSQIRGRQGREADGSKSRHGLEYEMFHLVPFFFLYGL